MILVIYSFLLITHPRFLLDFRVVRISWTLSSHGTPNPLWIPVLAVLHRISPLFVFSCVLQINLYLSKAAIFFPNKLASIFFHELFVFIVHMFMFGFFLSELPLGF